MSYTTYGGATVEQNVQRLQQRVSSLASDIDDLQEKHRTLNETVDEVDERVDQLESAQEQLREAHDELVEEVHDDIATIAATVKTLAATIGWIERRLRAERDITAVPLDEVEDTVRQLAERARQGQQSKSVLLSQQVRAQHQQHIDRVAEIEQRIDRKTALLLQHSATLATSLRGSSTYTAAGNGYRAATVALAGDQAQLPAARQAATEARRALNLDDKHREVHGPQVMTGEAARARLRETLRARLDTAVADGALLPAWLTLVFGHQPVGEDVAAWMELATSLLEYRVTYQVTDPVDALGATVQDDPQREVWHKNLDHQLRKRRHWPL